ncbi:signal transduction histidine kinase [Parvularcula dongshanensis]|uniref:histidine kinase n=2 Tax=Parvularcula dongshanensis TaxID=1173995 RepID=A0A840I7C2_9PROT|nr:signal transduction histidine kinase [Parvularcula dongshanensis]
MLGLGRVKRSMGLRAPILAQVVGLVLFSVLVSQAVNVAVILTSRPPERTRFEAAEVASVLLGEPTQYAQERLRAQRAPHPPADSEEDFVERELRQTLATTLGRDPSQVRVVLRRGPGPQLPPLPPDVRRGMPRPSARPYGVGPQRTEGFVAAARGKESWVWVTPRRGALIEAWQARLLLWLLATMLLVLPIAYLFARRLTAPIRAFADAAEQLGRDPQAENIALSGPAEVGKATVAFNEMQARLRAYVDDRIRMIGAIAHDLRTPLTRLAFRLEGLEEPARRKAQADIKEMEDMIAATLSFVRDASRVPSKERLDLRALVESVTDNAAEMGGQIKVEPGNRLVVHGDPIALRALLTNLLNNALTYGGGGATVRLGSEEGRAFVEIDDDGAGLPPDQLERVFDPFYRAEGSRNKRTGGIGLGLSVARTVARAHGGEVALSNLPEGGLQARVTLAT